MKFPSRISSANVTKSLTENFIFCAVWVVQLFQRHIQSSNLLIGRSNCSLHTSIKASKSFNQIEKDFRREV